MPVKKTRARGRSAARAPVDWRLEGVPSSPACSATAQEAQVHRMTSGLGLVPSSPATTATSHATEATPGDGGGEGGRYVRGGVPGRRSSQVFAWWGRAARGIHAQGEASPRASKALIAAHEWTTTFFAGCYVCVSACIAVFFAGLAAAGEAYGIAPAGGLPVIALSLALGATACLAGLRVYHGCEACRFLRHGSREGALQGERCRMLARVCAAYPILFCLYVLACDAFPAAFGGAPLVHGPARKPVACPIGRAFTAAAAWAAWASGPLPRRCAVLCVLPIALIGSAEGALRCLRASYLAIAERKRHDAPSRAAPPGALCHKCQGALVHPPRSQGIPSARSARQGRRPVKKQPEASDNFSSDEERDAGTLRGELTSCSSAACASAEALPAAVALGLSKLVRQELRRRHDIVERHRLSLFYKTVHAAAERNRLQNARAARKVGGWAGLALWPFPVA